MRSGTFTSCGTQIAERVSQSHDERLLHTRISRRNVRRTRNKGGEKKESKSSRKEGAGNEISMTVKEAAQYGSQADPDYGEYHRDMDAIGDRLSLIQEWPAGCNDAYCKQYVAGHQGQQHASHTTNLHPTSKMCAFPTSDKILGTQVCVVGRTRPEAARKLVELLTTT